MDFPQIMQTGFPKSGIILISVVLFLLTFKGGLIYEKMASHQPDDLIIHGAIDRLHQPESGPSNETGKQR